MAGRGWSVTGSDRSRDHRQQLAQIGWQVEPDTSGSVIPPSTDIVVYSDAVDADHPQRREATVRGILQLSYARMLGRMMRRHERVAVAGTHGKSTITAMAAEILVAAGMDPTIVCGAGPVAESPTGGRAGRGDIFLAEACEYRENFLHLRPRVAAISGIEPDHFDYYGDLQALQNGFSHFIAQIPIDGHLFVRAECPNLKHVCRSARCPVKTYGLVNTADWWAHHVVQERGKYHFTVMHRRSSIGRVRLNARGRHNMANGLAAAALASRFGAPPQAIVGGLRSFSGLHRRLEHVALRRGVHIWDDYAHHPTAVRATLRALREIHPNARLWCVFQSHQVSRTERLLDEFAESLQNADVVAVAPVFRAREGPSRRGEVTASDLARVVRESGTPALAFGKPAEILNRLKMDCRPGDVLVTLGAGDIWKLSYAFADRI
jgi:UDP-N-acetylmuramate--alanine ligase